KIEGKNRDRNIHLEWVGKTSSTASAASATAKNKENFDEKADDGRTMADDVLTTQRLPRRIRRTMADDGGRSSDYTSSAKNTSDDDSLDNTNDLVDDADAKFPPYSNGEYNASDEFDPYEAEERLAIQEESAETSTIEVGVAHNAPEFEYI